tara:strand:+ start:10898 stop:11581 length:684 start_codon:yes stop_codon:yes gene_type:complete
MKTGFMKIAFTFFVILFWSCSRPAIPEPSAVDLITPEKNNTCIPIYSSDTEGVINFDWTESLNTDSYEIFVRNSITGSEQKKAIYLTSTKLTLERGMPYIWWIISKSEISPVTTKSSIWTFYLEGLQQQDYLPFAAQLINPQEGQTISLSSGKYSLQWIGSDLDNDIAYYQVYIGITQSQLSLVQDNQITSSYEVSLLLGETYYWKIVTLDESGNRSESIIQSFTTS